MCVVNMMLLLKEKFKIKKIKKRVDSAHGEARRQHQ